MEDSQLIQLNEELENYFQNTIIPQLFIDAELKLRKFSPPAMKHFTLSQDDIGRNIGDIIANILYPTVIENIKEVIATGKNLEKEIQTLDSRWFQMNIIPYVIRKENKTNGVIVTFVDITQRIDTLQELEKLNTDHETFIASVTHDLKQPLSILSLMGDELAYAFDSNDSRQFNDNLGRLNRCVDNLKEKINELADLNTKKSEISERERVNIENIFEDVTLVLKDEIHHQNVHIETAFETSEIYFSRKNLRSILYNLMSNAIKYKKPGLPVQILIKTYKADDYVVLSVTDNGIGIEHEHLKSIFDRYTRINHNVEGTGLGLYLVCTMVKQKAGKVEVQSTPGEGSTFRVFFKVNQGQQIIYAA